MSACVVCAYAAEYGSWPLSHRGTHCDHCHRSWAGFKEAHCVAVNDGRVCCLHFSTDVLAEKHRVGGRCLTETELLVFAAKNGRRVFRKCPGPDGTVTWRYAETLRLSAKPAFLEAVR